MHIMLSRIIRDFVEQEIELNPAVVLLGARQVGKTTLAKNIAKQIPSVYLDLESPSALARLVDSENYFYENSNKLIILDEIQRLPEIFTVLRGVIDSNRQKGKEGTQFLLLGSASMDLLRQTSESLAGRISYVEMSGINILEASPDKTNQLWLRGSFPKNFLARSDKVAMRQIENLIRTYLERDLAQMGFNVPAIRLRQLWTMLAHLQGETLNFTNLASNLEVDRKTINYYIDILTDLFLVRRVEPWYANVKKRLVKSPRYYVRDSGILHRLLGIGDYDSLLSNPILGKSWEGFVAENLHSVMPPLAQTYFFRTASGTEIDFVIKMPNSEIWAIEIKFGRAPKIGKSFNHACDLVGAKRKFIVYGGDEEFPVGNNVRVISLPNIMKKLIAEH